MQSAFVDKDHWDTAVFSSNKNSVNKNKPELDLLTNDESCKKQAGTGTTDNKAQPSLWFCKKKEHYKIFQWQKSKFYN